MSSLIDFTNCKRVYGKAYNGANGKKIAVIYDGNRYMIKFPPSGEHKPADLSYTNSCISEYAKQPKCPKKKEDAIVEALRHFQMI